MCSGEGKKQTNKQTKDCVRAWTFQHKSKRNICLFPVCFFWCLPDFITIPHLFIIPIYNQIRRKHYDFNGSEPLETSHVDEWASLAKLNH